MSQPDGAPAFPVQSAGHTIRDGLSIRDYFAAQAMAAQIVYDAETPSCEVAADAYVYADDMLAERAKGGAA